MATEIDYAWMAAAENNENRNEFNLIRPPDGWVRIPPTELAIANTSSGFAAEVFKHSSGEIVISYRGTDLGAGPFSETIQDFTRANIPLAAGTGFGQQAIDTAQLYFQVRALAGTNTNQISFTGHSLRGAWLR